MADTGPIVAGLDGALVRYGPRAIGPLDLALAPGEIVALVGASGAGKSTALRLLAGLRSPDQGRAVTAAGRTGVVFQAPTLLPWATALENVALPLRLARLPKAQAHERAIAALAAVGLGDRLDARPAELSGGMAMRTALARALVTRPALLLLDEPFAALDTVTRRRLIEDLHRLWRDGDPRPTVVFVTHDVDEAVYLAARTLILNHRTGAVVCDLPSPGVLPRPSDWRLNPDYRAGVETVAAALAADMQAVA